MTVTTIGNRAAVNAALGACASRLASDNDRAFLHRVWATPQSDYEGRLRAIGFTGLRRVLDAGCGFGQWSMAMARVNEHSIGVDPDAGRLDIAARMAEAIGPGNVEFRTGRVEALPFKDGTYDGIFSYSVLNAVDHRAAIGEFFRVLRPGGRLYVNVNALGWYLRNLVDGGEAAADFSPRSMAIAALQNSLDFLGRGNRQPGVPVVLPKRQFLDELKADGFEVEAHGPDGTVRLAGTEAGKPFFPPTYFGIDGVYEVLCRKPGER